MLAKADEIELIDLPPEDLIKRLHEGKVYVPEQARRAVSNFFSPGNLTALREMALRHAAERVDAQMRRLHAGPRHPRPLAGARADPGVHRRTGRRPAKLVRVAKRTAERRARAVGGGDGGDLAHRSR